MNRPAWAIVAAGTVGVVTTFLLNFMQGHEGRRYVPYRDPVGVLTVCDGVTNRAAPGWVIAGHRYSDAECDAKEIELINTVFAPAVAACTKVDITQRQWEMLIDFAWNEGAENLCTSTLMRRINAGDIPGATREFDRWTRAGKRILPGLVTRRADEKKQFQTWPVGASGAAR